MNIEVADLLQLIGQKEAMILALSKQITALQVQLTALQPVTKEE